MEELQSAVVVVGAGLAGFTAALTAAEQGVEVLLCEKQDEVGGSTVMSGGSFCFTGTDLQAAQGIEDSPELLREDLIEVGQHRNDLKLVDRYVRDNLAAYHWLRERGVEFGQVQAASGQSVPRSHPSNPRRVIDLLHAAARQVPNLTVVTGVTADRLVQDHETGRVVAVQAHQGDQEFSLRAERGVVLTSGGFCQNKEMIAAFAPGKERALRLGGLGNYGDGIRMAWQLGAGLRDMPYVKGTFGNHPQAQSGHHTACMAVYKGAIAVNKQGRRFVDESLDYKLLGDACLEQEDALGFQIFDEAVMRQSVPGYPMFDFRRRITEGRLITAPSLEELAGKIGIDPGRLKETVASYNEIVREGLDDPIGRKHLTHRFGSLVRLEEPPFYAYPSTSAIIATYAGITVDDDARVLDIFGDPIPGLYAAGEVMGGFHGAAYMTGTSLGKATVFGRIAGRRAAQAIA
jgi:fumarate reductase flavoprotein subunit